MYTVMIVDDDSTSLAIGKAILESDYKVVLMRSGVQALGYLNNNPPPDAILLDMIMPGTTGLDVIAALKAHETLNKVPVLFVTGVEDMHMETQAYVLGASDFIQKPLNPIIIKKKIEHYIRFCELEAENAKIRKS